MTSTIKAVTTGGGGIASTSDNSGNLSLLAGPNEIVAITAAGANIIGALTMSSGTPDTAITTQAQSAIAFTTSGTGNAYTLTPSPAVSAYASGQRFTVTLHTTPALLVTTPVTLNISGLGVKNFKYYNAQGIKVFINSWVTQTNWISDVIYDGTDMVLMNPLHRASGPSTQKAIFGYGYSGAYVSITNLVSNTGVVGTDVTGVGTVRQALAAAGYGTDKAIFGYGYVAANVSMTSLVSNTGVVSTDVTGVGTARRGIAAAGYGTDKAIFGYGYTIDPVSMTNLVSNTGVVATDTTGVGTARYYLAAAGFSLT